MVARRIGRPGPPGAPPLRVAQVLRLFAAATEPGCCTTAVLRVKALAPRPRGGLRGGTAQVRTGRREGTRESLPVYVTLNNIKQTSFITSFMLLLLTAGPLSLPLLCGIDRVLIQTTFCLLRHGPLPEPHFFQDICCSWTIRFIHPR